MIYCSILFLFLYLIVFSLTFAVAFIIPLRWFPTICDNVVHILVCLGKLHLVHALARVPVQERSPVEELREVSSHFSEKFFDCRVETDESRRGFVALRWNIADSIFEVVWKEIFEVRHIILSEPTHGFSYFRG